MMIRDICEIVIAASAVTALIWPLIKRLPPMVESLYKEVREWRMERFYSKIIIYNKENDYLERKKYEDLLDGYLKNDRIRVIVVWGDGGVGKSSISRTVADRFQRERGAPLPKRIPLQQSYTRDLLAQKILPSESMNEDDGPPMGGRTNLPQLVAEHLQRSGIVVILEDWHLATDTRLQDMIVSVVNADIGNSKLIIETRGKPEDLPTALRDSHFRDMHVSAMDLEETKAFLQTLAQEISVALQSAPGLVESIHHSCGEGDPRLLGQFVEEMLRNRICLANAALIQEYLSIVRPHNFLEFLSDLFKRLPQNDLDDARVFALLQKDRSEGVWRILCDVHPGVKRFRDRLGLIRTTLGTVSEGSDGMSMAPDHYWMHEDVRNALLDVSDFGKKRLHIRTARFWLHTGRAVQHLGSGTWNTYYWAVHHLMEAGRYSAAAPLLARYLYTQARLHDDSVKRWIVEIETVRPRVKLNPRWLLLRSARVLYSDLSEARSLAERARDSLPWFRCYALKAQVHARLADIARRDGHRLEEISTRESSIGYYMKAGMPGPAIFHMQRLRLLLCEDGGDRSKDGRTHAIDKLDILNRKAHDRLVASFAKRWRRNAPCSEFSAGEIHFMSDEVGADSLRYQQSIMELSHELLAVAERFGYVAAVASHLREGSKAARRCGCINMAKPLAERAVALATEDNDVAAELYGLYDLTWALAAEKIKGKVTSNDLGDRTLIGKMYDILAGNRSILGPDQYLVLIEHSTALLGQHDEISLKCATLAQQNGCTQGEVQEALTSPQNSLKEIRRIQDGLNQVAQTAKHTR